MKVIDLLNKIANGEELPEYELIDELMIWGEIVYDLEKTKDFLNQEIIEEPKKIEKLDLLSMYLPSEVKVIDLELQNKLNEIIDYINKGE